MTERIPKVIFIAVAALGALLLGALAFSRPGYFISQTYLGGLLLLEFMAVAVWLYRRIFFLLLIVTFLLAGVDLPVGSIWEMARWMVLGLGALVGFTIVLKERQFRFTTFHALAAFAVLAAGVSAAVSKYGFVSGLKALSLALLFIYAATGARLAVNGRENQFFRGLLIGCEIFTVISALFYFAGIEAMGNPNSLGAVMGVVVAPVLLWGTLLQQQPIAYRRRMLLYALAMYLTFASHARAGMLAAFVSCGLLCVALRRYRLLACGIGMIAIVAAASAIIQPDAFSHTLSSLTSTLVFKGRDAEKGILSSRTSPWQDTVDSIHKHFWFGTGFGTSDTTWNTQVNVSRFSTVSATSAEHGSSFLAIVAWVGMLGIFPFALLLGSLLGKIVQTIAWMWRFGNPAHAAIPLALIMVAGMAHAFFEDWLFAPGYYLCVFYWSMAFVLVDQVRCLSRSESRLPSWRTRAVPEFGAVVPLR